MAKLKPIGSEKLQGEDKLKRIMEIATFRMPNSTISESSSDYSIGLVDGNTYHIVKEKNGYIIKKGVNESTSDYIEPIENRKHYNSYSQALKRLNLIIKEVNTLNGYEEEVTLFGEQKKFVLKSPRPMEPVAPVADEPAVPTEPPVVPEPELPQDNAGEEIDVTTSDAMDLTDVPLDSEEGNIGGMEVDDKVSWKVIQKLTGKLTQKLRLFADDEEMTSENIKYVINMVLSSLDLAKLSTEDTEDIMTKFEDIEAGDEMDMGSEMPMGEPEVGMSDEDMDISMEGPTDESYGKTHIYDSLYKESKVDKVLSKYFEITESEKKFNKEVQKERKSLTESQINFMIDKIEELSQTIEQELAGKEFVKENSDFRLVGKTNLNNLVFENKTKQVKVSPEGIVL
jgi:hypothetical protein